MKKHILRALTLMMTASLLMGTVPPASSAAPVSVDGLSPRETAAPAEHFSPANWPPAPTDPESKIDADLVKQFQTASQADFFIWLTPQAYLSPAGQLKTKLEKGRFVFDALRTTAQKSQRNLRAYLDAQGTVYRPYYIVNRILVREGSQNLVYNLAERSDVARITANHYYQLIEPVVEPPKTARVAGVEPNLSFVNADDVWALGITGEGAVLAGNDTGLDWEHPAIQSHYRGWDGAVADHNYNWWDTTGTFPDAPGDDHGHGTHTTGTMVGDDGGSNQIGMAPGAKTIHCKNMYAGGGGNDSNFIECFEWDLAPWDLSGNNPRPDLAPDAVNNSWGYWYGGNDVFADAIAALQAAGIVVEVSAGNEGPDCSTLRSPGDYGEVLTTGSVSHASGTLPGSLTDFSSRGPSSLSGDFIPDIMAPGEDIRSSLPGGDYEYWSGTSMAGPHTTGLIGLMWSANPALRGMVAETQQIIMNTAVPLAGQTGSSCGGDYTVGPNNDWGYGAFDALAAVEAALTFSGAGALEGVVTDSVSADPLSDVRVRASLSPTMTWNMRTDENGYYHRLVFSGTYTVSSQLYGYYPAEISGASVISGATTTLNIAMDPAPTFIVSGTVTDATTGWPLYAQIDIAGYPYSPVWSDPVTGIYSVTLAAEIEYTFDVTAWVAGYNSLSRVVAPLTGNQVEDFALQADIAVCTAPGYQAAFDYFEDFEASDGGYTTTGVTSFEWGTPTSGPGSAYSGENAWATNLAGDYSNDENGGVESPDINLSALAGGGGGDTAIIVTWRQWLQTEECCDFGFVEVSNDGGSTWATYYGPISGAMDTEWTKYTLYLDSSYAVSNFRIRFSLSSDGSVTAPGFYLDDVGIGAVVQPPALYAEDFEADDGDYTVSGTTSWEWGTPVKGPGSAHSGTRAWATNLAGNYGNNENGVITSPLIDLSAAAPAGGGGSPWLLLSWEQWLQTESGYDFASVQVSNGISWADVYTATGVIDLEWDPYTVLLDPETYAVADFQVRFRLQSDNSVTYPGFYLDDVSITQDTSELPRLACDVQSGGLAVGNVFDVNTGSGLNGARVASSAGNAFTQATEPDPAVDDGFYTLFAPTGVETLTATLEGYGPDAHTLVITLGTTVRQDFELPSGILSITPDGLETTLQLGDVVTLPLTLTNLGGMSLDWEAVEAVEGFPPFPYDTPWLATEPVTGTLPVSGTQVIAVTLDAGVPEMTQPGQYFAILEYVNTTPHQTNIPVTMTVNAPANWGQLSGQVNSLGYCDTAFDPLYGAMVEIAPLGAALYSDWSGGYTYWMPQGSYTVTVSAAEHLTQTFSVDIQAGETTAQSTDLRRDQPCLAVSVAGYDVTLLQGTAITFTFKLTNTGAGALSAQFYESDLELSLITPALGNVPRVVPSGIRSGPASLMGRVPPANAPVGGLPLSGWFGGLDLPGGLVHYAWAQCPEQPASFYVFGGASAFETSNKAWRYDAGDNTWYALADMPWGIEAPAATCYQGRIYVMGGSGSSMTLVYEIASNQWSWGPSLPRGVEGAAAASWDGKLYLVGGDDDFTPETGVSDEVNIYDIATDTWLANGAPLPVATSSAGFTQIGAYLYVVGGWGEMASAQNVTATQRYDLSTDSWEVGPTFTSARADLALAATDQKLYAIGGDQNGNSFLDAADAVEQLDLAAWPGGNWSALGDPLPVSVTANSAGFCTQQSGHEPKIWSVGSFFDYVISGRSFFREMPGQSCPSIYGDVPWLSIQPSYTQIAGGSARTIRVVLNADHLGAGAHTATVAIVTNDPGHPLYYLPVRLTVIGKMFLPLVVYKLP